MTTQPSEPPAEKKEIPNYKLYIVAVITGIISYFIAALNPNLSFISIILIWPSFVAAAGCVEFLCRYGLGTGTSSIGYWGTACGATVVFASQFIGTGAYSPFLEIAIATLLGYAAGLCANKIIRMKIPRIEVNSAIIAGGTGIITLVVLEVLAGGAGIVGTTVYYIYPVMYIGIAIGILHPYNGSLGEGENQPRTLMLALCEGALLTALFGFIGILLPNAPFIPALGMLIISIIGFVIFVSIWWKRVKKEAYDIVWAGYPAGVDH